MTEHAIRRRLASDHTALGEHHEDVIHAELDRSEPLPISGHAFPSQLEVFLTVPPWWRKRGFHHEIDFGY